MHRGLSSISRRSGTISLFLVIIAASVSITISVVSASDADPKNLVVPSETERVVVLPLTTNDVVYDPVDGKLYVSVPSSAGSSGNSVRQIDPSTFVVGDPVLVGSEPNKLALSKDGSSLYVGLDGAFAVRRFDTTSQTPGQQFSTRFNSTSRFKISDMVVSPDDPNIVAIARNYVGISPPEAGVAIFTGGAQLPNTGPDHSEGCDFLAFSAVGSTLYGTNQFGEGLQIMSINGSGVSAVNTFNLPVGGSIKFGGTKLFTSIGQEIDTSTNTLLGTFPSVASAAFVPDESVGRSYYLVKDFPNHFWTLKAYDNTTFTLVGSLNLNNVQGDATSLVRWGANGLAFRTTANQLFIIQTTLIPSSEPIPGPTVIPTPTITPSPMPFETSANFAPITANDIIYQSLIQKLYASVPSSVGSQGNSVARIDPMTGTVENSTWIGSEPNKLALASDQQTIYVGLDGSRAVRTFGVSGDVPGTQFPVGITGFDGPLAIVDMAAAPDNPNMLAVSRCSTIGFPCSKGTAIFDSGVPRPQVSGDSNSLDFSLSSSTLYGGSSSSGLEVMSVTANGISNRTVLPFNSGARIKFGNGLVYGSTGQVINPATQDLVGTFNIDFSTSQVFVLDVPNNRIFFFSVSSNLQIKAFDLTTFLPIGTITIPNYTGTILNAERWGANGLVIAGQNRPLLILQSTLVNSAQSVPGSVTLPTPTPSPTPMPAFVRLVNQLTNDFVVNQGEQEIYATVPGIAGGGTGNTVTRINPLTGNNDSSVFIGSEPGKIAFDNASQTTWVNLAGANAVRRFDIATQTPGLQFVPNPGSSSIRDMEIVPGTSASLVISSGNGGAAIYDNGVKRPNITHRPPPSTFLTASIGPIVFTGDPNILYGFNNLDSGSDLYKIAIVPDGLNTISGVSNLITGSGNQDIRFIEGKIFTPSGRVVDPNTNTIVGTYILNGSPFGGSAFAVDPQLRRVFVAVSSVIVVYDMDTFLPLGTISFSNPSGGTVTNLVRWGANGLALRVQKSSSDNYLMLIQSPGVSPLAPIPTGLSLDTSSTFLSESSGNVTVNVLRTGDTTGTSSINYSTVDGTAAAGSDYVAAGGTLTFLPGEASKPLRITLLNDTTFEGGNETFSLNISNPSSGVELLSPASATINIIDNDSRPGISIDDTTVTEGPVGSTSTVNVPVHLSNPSVETVSVQYATSNGTATAGTDYVSASGTIVFAPLETTKTIPMVVNGDGVPESNESFFINLNTPSNGSLFDSQAAVTIVDFTPPAKTRADFDGDGKTDVTVYGTTDGNWFSQKSGSGVLVQQWGQPGDVPVPGDYDGDGKADVAVYRPSNGVWFIVRSSNSTVQTTEWGGGTSVPVAADYDGDGKTDVAVYQSGLWYIVGSTSGVRVAEWGEPTDIVVPGDYDGDGHDDIAIYRSGLWYVLGSTAGTHVYQWGEPGDVPVQGDYDGDGKADVAVYRSGLWYVLNSTGGFHVTEWGEPTDIPVPGDYDGDGHDDIAIYRSGLWYVLGSTSGFRLAECGSPTDIPIPPRSAP